MRRHLVSGLVAASLAVLVLGVAFAATGSSKSASKSTSKEAMYHYLVIAPHTPEECLKTLDEVSAEGAETLAKFSWGCKAGDHTGYAMVTAKDEAGALAFIPEAGRATAKAIKLNKFTMEEIKAFHSSMEEKK